MSHSYIITPTLFPGVAGDGDEPVRGKGERLISSFSFCSWNKGVWIQSSTEPDGEKKISFSQNYIQFVSDGAENSVKRHWKFEHDAWEVYFTFSRLTLGLAGEGLGLFLTSIQDSESRSGRLAERPLGIVLRFDVSDSVLVFCLTGLEVLGEPVEEDTVIITDSYWSITRVHISTKRRVNICLWALQSSVWV